MTDQELFFKYNMVETQGMKRDEKLEQRLFNNMIKCDTPKVHDKVLILLHANYSCNLKCIYCENQHLRSEYRNAVMEERLVREIVQKLNYGIREVTWHGGEPLLLPENLFLALEEEKHKLNLNFRTSLQTNSVLMTKEKDKFLTDNNISWGTSFDGIKNDISRGKLSTENIFRCLNEFPEKVGFISVTHKDTIDLLIDNYEYYKECGFRATQNCIVRENVIEESNPYLVPNNIAIPKMIEYIDYWIHDTNNPILDSYVTRQITRILGQSRICEDSYCIGGWIIIDPFGNITHCGHSAQDECICNISDIDSYQDLLNHPKYIEMIYKQKKLIKKECSNCKWYHACYGGCMGLNYEYDHDYNHVSPRNCEYIKGTLEGIYELIKDIDTTQVDKYNPLFLDLLRDANYYSLTEIKNIEEKYSNG